MRLVDTSKLLALPASVRSDEDALRCLRRMKRKIREQYNRNAPAALKNKALRSLMWDTRHRRLPISRAIIQLRPVLYPDRLKTEDGDPRELIQKQEWEEDTRFDNDLKGHPLLGVADPRPTSFSDPYEDFDTYDETDPSNRITPNGNSLTATLYEHEDAWLSDDKGLDHFGGDFEHLIEWRPTGHSVGGDTNGFVYGQSDVNGNLMWNNNSIRCILHWENGPDQWQTWSGHREGDVGQDFDATALGIPAADNTWNYNTIYRLDTTVTCEIYSDTDRTVSLADLEFDDDGDPRQFIYSCCTFNIAVGRWVSVEVANLDLQEDYTCPSDAITSLKADSSLTLTRTNNILTATPSSPIALDGHSLAGFRVEVESLGGSDLGFDGDKPRILTVDATFRHRDAS